MDAPLADGNAKTAVDTHVGDDAPEVVPVKSSAAVNVSISSPGAQYTAIDMATQSPAHLRMPGPWELRFRSEAQLLQRQAVPLFVSLAGLIYFALMVFRNLAYYRYRTVAANATRLHDVGHDIFPELAASKESLADIPIHVYFGLLGVTLLAALRPSDTVNRPYLANVTRRVLQFWLIGHCLRALTYLATTLPGSADHCMPGAHMDPPTSVGSCFTRLASVNGNCGDLIFSGHMLLMWMGMCILWTYGDGAWGLERLGIGHKLLLCLGLAFVIAQACMILAARHHYSVDVVVASYTTPLLWHFHGTVLLKEDMEVDVIRLRRQLELERTWPRWRHVLRGIGVFVGACAALLVGWTVMKGNLKFFT
eukprot:TRINITY_DN30712_c0_g1_i1.p1 TRINITY_DN30712_c0_g1~~TRINITY_DN30712_c0_g1_i1.p1  ORF type:complete len:365 (+),score=36.45 TRINITY_DN30712_c0_g1_i1:50-1144(+)